LKSNDCNKEEYMKKNLLIAGAGLFALAALMSPIHPAMAEEDPVAQEEAAATDVKDRPEWSTALKEQYNLTDEQMKSLQSKGFNYPQMFIVAGLASKSGKTIDEVAAMRQDQKMGWGKIAKELGLPPGEIGKSVSEMRHKINGDRKAARADAKAEARAEKQAQKEEKRADRMEKKAAKAQEKAEKGHGH
jgi:hypothetical protein